MSIRPFALLAGAALLLWALVSPAQALSEQECSAKYHAAQSAGMLNGMTWNDFRKAECEGDAAPAAAAPAATTQPNSGWASSGSGQSLSEQECSVRYHAAQAAGMLNGMTWNEFRRAECEGGASPTAAAPAAPAMPDNSVSPSGSGQALSEHDCSVKYQGAKSAGTLNGMSWNDFRRTQCEGGTSTQAAAPAAPADSGGLGSWLQSLFPDASAPSAGQPAQQSSVTGAPPAPSYPPMDTGNVVFPGGISRLYANMTAGEGREFTCLDQYRANKANGGNGSLEWIEKGGGYFSECDKRLGGK